MIPANLFTPYASLIADANAGRMPAEAEAIPLGQGASTTRPAETIVAIAVEVRQRWADRGHATWGAVLMDRAGKLEILRELWSGYEKQ